jgi:nucleolar complex protein 3
MTCCLSWPPNLVIKVLDLLGEALVKYDFLSGMIDRTDSKGSGHWRGEADDPQMTNPDATVWWELSVLQTHYSEKVREKAVRLSSFVKE